MKSWETEEVNKPSSIISISRKEWNLKEKSRSIRTEETQPTGSKLLVPTSTLPASDFVEPNKMFSFLPSPFPSYWTQSTASTDNNHWLCCIMSWKDIMILKILKMSSQWALPQKWLDSTSQVRLKCGSIKTLEWITQETITHQLNSIKLLSSTKLLIF